MGIAEAIERVKRQARQVGLGTVIGGFGEQLRSPAIPSPLRGAAWRIAALLDAACPNTSAAPNERARELIHQDRSAIGRTEPRPTTAPAQVQSAAARVNEREPSGMHETSSTRNGVRAVAADEVVPAVPRSSVREVSATAIDTGERPEEPVEGAVVDPAVVGATPTFNATPVEVEPVDATPVDEAPIDALEQIVEVVASDGVVANDPDTASDRNEASAALAIEAARDSASPETSAPATDVDELASISAAIAADVDASQAEGEPAISAQTGSAQTGSAQTGSTQTGAATTGKPAKPRAKSASPRKRSTPPPAAASGEPKKEKLAQASEDAKSLARSNSKSANRRSGAKADTSKKK